MSLLQEHAPCCTLSIGLHEDTAEFGGAPSEVPDSERIFILAVLFKLRISCSLGSYLQTAGHTGESRRPAARHRLLWLQVLQREHNIAHLQGSRVMLLQNTQASFIQRIPKGPCIRTCHQYTTKRKNSLHPAHLHVHISVAVVLT